MFPNSCFLRTVSLSSTTQLSIIGEVKLPSAKFQSDM